MTSGFRELDRVLGGGLVTGSMVLVGGDPGIGKSTLLHQICEHLGRDKKILYVSGEESPSQLKLRAQRLGVSAGGLFVMSETGLDLILHEMEENSPDIVIIDSIQTVYRPDLTSSPGSVSQIRECAAALMQSAKADGRTILLVGHMTKDGTIAGPKVLEHMVDCVLYFEGDRHFSYRILRAVKNRFGSTNEIGMFEMLDRGLQGWKIPRPSSFSGRPVNVPGSCVSCVLEGSRPILTEVQALVSPSSFGNPRRMCTGFDYGRLPC
jgi:DNA repair protein RadA/Sms